MSVDFSKIELDRFFTLYKIQYIAQAWYYTDADHEIFFDGNTYSPATIKHGEIIKDIELKKIQLEVNMPLNTIVQRYIAEAPPAKTIFTLYLYSESTPPEYFVAFKGEVIKVSIGQNNACSIMLDEYGSLSAKLPRLIIQPSCNHVLFSPECGLIKAAWKTIATVGSLGTSTIIYSEDFLPYDNGYFKQGIVEFNGDFRHISFHNGIQVSIQSCFFDLKEGDVIFLYPGCDKTPETCRDKFSNFDNYLGFPYVPRKNPVLTGF